MDYCNWDQRSTRSIAVPAIAYKGNRSPPNSGSFDFFRKIIFCKAVAMATRAHRLWPLVHRYWGSKTKDQRSKFRRQQQRRRNVWRGQAGLQQRECHSIRLWNREDVSCIGIKDQRSSINCFTEPDPNGIVQWGSGEQDQITVNCVARICFTR